MEERTQLAKEYIDRQLEEMKRCGMAPEEDLSDAEYQGLIEDLTQAIDLK